MTNPTPSPGEPRLVECRCLECGAKGLVPADSAIARGVFNYFCPDKDCEDNYAWKQ